MSSPASRLEALHFRPRGPCALCEGIELVEERNIGGFPIQRCGACGFLQTGTTLDQSAIDAYYSDAYAHTGLRMVQGQQVNASVNSMILGRLGLLAHRPSVLDVGCGFGFLLAELRERHGIEGIGIELAGGEREYGREILNLDIRPGLDSLGEQTFDLVTLFEVMEHIASPVEFLRGVADRLSPGGVLVVGTDNFDCDIVRSMGDRFPKWIPHQHISLFDDRTLPKLIERAGTLTVVARASFTPWELLAQKWASWATGGRRGGKSFVLDEELSTESTRPFRMFEARRRFNKLWAGSTLRADLSGEMMIVVARKAS